MARDPNAIHMHSPLDVDDVHKLRRLSSVRTREAYTLPPQPPPPHNPILAAIAWYLEWAIPGLGMFSEAYIIFSIGLIKPFQATLFPDCFVTHEACSESLSHAQNYLQICGIICGMLTFGVLGDYIGRKWGSRLVATIMLTGTILLTFTPLSPNAYIYYPYFLFSQCWYGFGVGGEYPMASSSAAERSQANPELRKFRGRQVVLVFSGQGMGNLVNGCVILICMVMFAQTEVLTPQGSRSVMSLQFAVGCAVTVFLTSYRYLRLKESRVWKAERKDAEQLAEEVQHVHSKHVLYMTAFKKFWPRLMATCLAWVANDFAFYGNKIFQSTFISILYPGATYFRKMQFTVLNSSIALTGYWCAAWLVDRPWYGRRRMQNVGFTMMFILFGICAIAYPQLTGSTAGLQGFQFLYYFSSFWNQFGPNCTTWLVAAEVYPTDVRATFQGISAAMGKVGAIIADVAFSYVADRTKFVLSAIFGLVGVVVTSLWLPDTTGMDLEELDRWNKYLLAGEEAHYHGEAINPRHLSLWERWVLKWQAPYDPAMDAAHKEVQMTEDSVRPDQVFKGDMTVEDMGNASKETAPLYQ